MIDRTKIFLKSGDGGNGIISFIHYYNNEKGGPDGGNGGHGGNIYLAYDSNLNDLKKVSYIKNFVADNGYNGKSQRKNGKQGANKILFVPENTYVYKLDNAQNKLICVINKKNKNVLLLKGGKGGRGNYTFKSSTNRKPLLCENGDYGEKGNFLLVLKMSAEFGIVGFPNAGKSTYINSITNANSKSAEYEFSTLSPVLGVINNKYNYKIIDIPGLIKDACKGKGLGVKFLQHIEMCKSLIFLLDITDNPIEKYKILYNEIYNYDKNIIKKRFFFIINKIDLIEYDNALQEIKNNCLLYFPKSKIFFISALNKNLSINSINNISSIFFKSQKEYSHPRDKNKDIDFHFIDLTKSNDLNLLKKNDDLKIEKINENTYEIYSEKLKLILHKIPLKSFQNVIRFNNKIKQFNIYEKLLKKGAKKGDNIIIYNHNFQLW